MRREWQNQPSTVSVATSLSRTRLLAAATVISLGLLAVGVAAASMVPPGSGAAAPARPATVAGAVEVAPPPEIDDAVAVERNGALVPAPVEHLTVVQVSVSTCGARSTGSGVVVADGLLLTAAHVVGDASLVRIDHRDTTVTGEVVGVLGDGRDVALVRVDAPMDAPLPVADRPVVGDAVTLVGHPDGGPRTVRVGEAAAVAPVVAMLAGGGDILGVDVAIAAGFSGGAAIDAAGDLIGLVVASEEKTGTALVVALPELATIESAGLVPGECPAGA